MSLMGRPFVRHAALGCVLAAGLGLRLRGLSAPVKPQDLYSNDYYYVLGANLDYRRNLSFDGENPSAFRMPLYPSVVALSRKLGSTSRPERLLGINAVFAALSMVLVYAVGSAISSSWCGILAAAAFAFAPNQIAFSRSFEAINIFTFSIIALASALIYWVRSRGTASCAAAGAALGFSLLIRSTLCALPFFAFSIPSLRRCLGWRGSAAFLMCAYLPLACWIMRNELHFRKFIPFEQGAAASNLYLASLGEIFTWHAEPPPFGWPNGPRPPENFDADPASAANAAFQNISRHPLRYLFSCVQRAFYFWRGHYVWLALAALGAFLGRNELAIQLLALFCLYFNVHCIMALSWRFVVPAEPLLILLAAFGLTEAAAIFHGRSVKPDGASMIPAVLGIALMVQMALVVNCAWLLSREVRSLPRGRISRQRAILPAIELAKTGDFQTAREKIRTASLAFETDSPVLNGLGMIDFLEGKKVAAVERFKEALSRDPRSFNSKMNLAAALASVGRPGEAARYYAEAYEDCLQGLGQREALEYLEKFRLNRPGTLKDNSH